MRVRLLGTGSADRWPNPWCTCASCVWARAHGQLRDRTSVLVDDSLLIDPGPDAGAGGVDLSGARTVLVGHDHPDHLDPAFLLAWSWVGAAPLLVAGPAQAIEHCREWVSDHAPVTLVALTAGDELTAGAHHVRALPAAHSTAGGHEHDGTALLFEVTGADGRLLYATDTAAVPHADLSGAFDLVLLEETFGDLAGHGTAHLDLPGFGREVARLQADGRLRPGARVIAVHLSHHNPIDVAARVAVLGGEVLPDGTELLVGQAGPPVPPTARRLLVTGGARSGKSRRAEELVTASGHRSVVYLATAPAYPDDAEWRARIDAHRARRPASWRTVETADVATQLRTAAPGTGVLVDCLTLWLTGLLDEAGWGDPPACTEAVGHALGDLLDALTSTHADVVLVTNEVGAGLVPEHATGRLFRDLLGRVNNAVAAACDTVEIVTCGIPHTLKGQAWTSTT